jgi:hypothetical protein
LNAYINLSENRSMINSWLTPSLILKIS